MGVNCHTHYAKNECTARVIFDLDLLESFSSSQLQSMPNPKQLSMHYSKTSKLARKPYYKAPQGITNKAPTGSLRYIPCIYIFFVWSFLKLGSHLLQVGTLHLLMTKLDTFIASWWVLKVLLPCLEISLEEKVFLGSYFLHEFLEFSH